MILTLLKKETMYNTVDENYRPYADKVFVKNMNFGEQISPAGIIVTGDDRSTRGIHPRWGQVHAKGPKNQDEFEVGDWVLVEHGRWTRGFVLGDEHKTIVRMIDNDCVLAWDKEPPMDVIIGD